MPLGTVMFIPLLRRALGLCQQVAQQIPAVAISSVLSSLLRSCTSCICIGIGFGNSNPERQTSASPSFETPTATVIGGTLAIIR